MDRVFNYKLYFKYLYFMSYLSEFVFFNLLYFRISFKKIKNTNGSHYIIFQERTKINIKLLFLNFSVSFSKLNCFTKFQG